MLRYKLLSLPLILLFALLSACGTPKATTPVVTQHAQQVQTTTKEKGVKKATQTTAASQTNSDQQKTNQPSATQQKTAKPSATQQSTAQQKPNQSQTKAVKPQYYIDPKTYEVKPIGNANPKVVLLTIDDAPNKNALQMAQTLKSLHAYAIFFINGHFLTPEKKQWLKQIHDMGFMLGNHTWNHRDLSKLSVSEQIKEIIPLNETLKSITGTNPKFFRAPFGNITPEARKLSQEQHMIVMNWSYGYDWNAKYENKAALTDIMVNSIYLHNGANLLMHDHPWTSDALAGIIKGLRAKGYTIVDPHLIKTLDQTTPNNKS